eukprot:COSAG02_NODE_1168_length_14134_cov_19.590310_4_plen_37_part_00
MRGVVHCSVHEPANAGLRRTQRSAALGEVGRDELCG